MSLSLYKPNSKNAGCAFNFSIGLDKKKEPVIYVNAIQQFSWDDNKKTGSFSGNGSNLDKKISLKFTEFEIGGIMSAFKNRYEYSSFHSYEENKTSIKFSPWDKKTKVKQQDKEVWVTIPAFGINLTRNGNQTFRIPLEPGEVEELSAFFNFYYNCLFSHRREIDLEKSKQYRDKNYQNKTNNSSSDEDSEAPF